MSGVPSKQEVDSLTSFEDDAFDRLLGGGSSALFGSPSAPSGTRASSADLFGQEDEDDGFGETAGPAQEIGEKKKSKKSKDGKKHKDKSDKKDRRSVEDHDGGASSSKKKKSKKNKDTSDDVTVAPAPPPPPPAAPMQAIPEAEPDASDGAENSSGAASSSAGFGSKAFLAELRKRRGTVLGDEIAAVAAEAMGAGSDDESEAPNISSANEQMSKLSISQPKMESSSAAAPVPAPAQTFNADALAASKSDTKLMKRVHGLGDSLVEALGSLDEQHSEETEVAFSHVFKRTKRAFDSDTIYQGTDVLAIVRSVCAEALEHWRSQHAKQAVEQASKAMQPAKKALEKLRKDAATVVEEAQQMVILIRQGFQSMLDSFAFFTPVGIMLILIEIFLGLRGVQRALVKHSNSKGGKSLEEVAAMEEKLNKALKSKEKYKQEKKELITKMQELEVWRSAVPELRTMLESAVEEKDALLAEKEDLTRLQQHFKLTWVPDDAATRCLNCDIEFGLRKWKNHCRYCGRVFCYDCTSRRTEIRDLGYNFEVPVCDHCYNLILGRRGGF